MKIKLILTNIVLYYFLNNGDKMENGLTNEL